MSELDEKALDSARWAYSRELYTGSHMSHIGAAEASLAAAIRAYLAAAPAPTRDDVLEEAAMVADEQAKQDRAERLAKAKTDPDECAYHLWAEQTAAGIAAKLRSLKGGKS